MPKNEGTIITGEIREAIIKELDENVTGLSGEDIVNKVDSILVKAISKFTKDFINTVFK